MKKLLLYHILPVIIAVFITILALFSLKSISDKKEIKSKLISGKSIIFRGVQPNYDAGKQAEINFLASIKDRKTISIFGSSELAGEAYSPYFFLPDSLGTPCIAFGHAFHQNFSIFSELLAAREYLKNSKICIILSPTWFITNGTNIESFLEFVPSDFLNKILFDEKISMKHKLKIAHYISKNYKDIESANSILKLYKNLEDTKNISQLNALIYSSRSNLKKVEFEVDDADYDGLNILRRNVSEIKKRIQKDFISSIKSNKIYVYDEYYQQYLLDEIGNHKKGNYTAADFYETQEFEDFLLVLEVLKKYKCNASFIIQPLNNYHFDGLENFKEINSKLKKEIEKNGFPYLDMFVYQKEKYEPGTLQDIMHLGNYGWLRINEFLMKTYKIENNGF